MFGILQKIFDIFSKDISVIRRSLSLQILRVRKLKLLWQVTTPVGDENVHTVVQLQLPSGDDSCL